MAWRMSMRGAIEGDDASHGECAAPTHELGEDPAFRPCIWASRTSVITVSLAVENNALRRREKRSAAMTFPPHRPVRSLRCSRVRLLAQASGRRSRAAQSTERLPTPVPLYTNLGSHHKSHLHQGPGRPALLRPGPATRLRVQSRGSDPRVPARAAELDPTCAMCYWGSPSPTVRTSTRPWTRRAAWPRTPRCSARGR